MAIAGAAGQQRASSSTTYRQDQQQQRRGAGVDDDMEGFAIDMFDQEPAEDSYAASAPPAPSFEYGGGTLQQQPQQHLPRAGQAVEQAPAAATAVAEEESEEEEPQYVLEW